ncbi:MAG: imidazolonepropionase [Chryseolinea sp.]
MVSEPVVNWDILIQNIKELVQIRPSGTGIIAGAAMAELPAISNAFLAISNGRIAAFGPMDKLPHRNTIKTIDATGRFVFPSFVDSHTHLIFAKSREEEFVLKIKGSSYAEIAAKGGGILNSARKIQQSSEDALFESALNRCNEIIGTGTGAVEIKSGYGLTVKDEMKMLRVARKLGQYTPLTVKTTFLGAHAIPENTTKEKYIETIINDMIPAVAAEKLADYIDVFCEQGFFSETDTERIVEAGKQYGLRPRIHANQLNRSGGVQVGVRTKAISVDHLENIGEEEIMALVGSSVIPTVLPGAAFFLNLPFPPARALIKAGLPVAIASDYNPGSAPSGNMQLMVAFACIRMKMTPEETINASTMNTACALELESDFGSITIGKKASLFITKPIPSLAYFPYAFGSPLIDTVILNGVVVQPV